MKGKKSVPMKDQAVKERFEQFATYLPDFIALSGEFREFYQLIRASNISGATSAALRQAEHISINGGKVQINDPLKALIEQKAFAAAGALIRKSVRAYTQGRRILHLASEEKPHNGKAKSQKATILGPEAKENRMTLFTPPQLNPGLPERLTLDSKDVNRDLEFHISQSVGDIIVAACQKYNITPSQFLEKIVRDYFGIKN